MDEATKAPYPVMCPGAATGDYRGRSTRTGTAICNKCGQRVGLRLYRGVLGTAPHNVMYDPAVDAQR